MRRGSAFGAVFLILLGVLFLMNNFGFLVGLRLTVWNMIWPLFLILLGVAFISRTVWRPAPAATEPGSVPLDGAGRAKVEIQHGAGQLSVSAGAAPELLAQGSFGGGLRARATQSGDLLDVTMRMAAEPAAFFNWAPGGYDWDVQLNPSIPLVLKLETGASRNLIDLRDLKVTELKLETGASASELTLPANAGYTRVRVQAGAARVDIRVPGGVAGRIKTSGALASVNVDQTRFPGTGHRYESPDYEAAANKVEIEIETGVGAVTIS